jgi:hypothetical protein
MIKIEIMTTTKMENYNYDLYLEYRKQYILDALVFKSIEELNLNEDKPITLLEQKKFKDLNLDVEVFDTFFCFEYCKQKNIFITSNDYAYTLEEFKNELIKNGFQLKK